MRNTLKSHLCLLMLLLTASIATAKEKLLVVVQKTDIMTISDANDLAVKTAKLPELQEKYEMISENELKKLYTKDFGRTENASDYDLSKIGAKYSADKILAIMLQPKSGSSLMATARLVEVSNEKIISFNKLDYQFGLEEFMNNGVKGLVSPLATDKGISIPQATLSITTNDPIKVYVDKKRVKDSFIGNLSLTEGYHEVFLQRENGYIIDKNNVYFSGDNTIQYNYEYTAKGNAVTKALLLPGLGHFSTGRNVSGSIYTAAAVGGLGLLGYGIMSYTQSKSDYDDAKSSSESAKLYQDRLAFADKANGFRTDCESANNLVIAGVAVFAVSYIASFLDVYFTGTEHKLDINGNENPFGSNLKFNGNSLVYSFGLNKNNEQHRDKQ